MFTLGDVATGGMVVGTSILAGLRRLGMRGAIAGIDLGFVG